MHLLTLLIAAAFSTQFTRPNELTGLSTIDPDTIGEFQLMTKLPEFVITYLGTAGEDPSDYVWTLAEDGGESLTINEDDMAAGAAEKTIEINAGVDASSLWTAALQAEATLTLTVADGESLEDDVEITVELAPTFTLSEDDITVEALTEIPALEITCEDTRGWVEEGMPAKYTIKDGEKFVETTISYDDSNAGWVVAAVPDITDLELVWGDLPVTLVLSFGVEVGGDVVVGYPKTAELILTPDPAFDVSPATITTELLAEPVEFTITDLGYGLAVGDKALVTVESEEPATGAFDEALAAGEGADEFTVTIDIAALEAEEGTTEVYFWVLQDTTVSKAFVLKYDTEADPTGEFEINPTEVEFADAATAGPFIFTNATGADPGTEWESTMKAKFTGSAGTQEFDVVEDDGEWATAKINIAGLVGAQGGEITVELAPAGTKYIPEMTKTITVKAPLPEASFVLKPTEITEEEEEVLLSAEPEGDDDWDGKVVSCIWTFTEEPPEGAVEGLTFVLEKNESERNQDTPYAYQATIDMTEVEIPDDAEYIYAWIMLEEPGEDKNQVQPTILEGYVRITYTRTPEDLSFTIDPKETKWVAALKTPLITIKPSDADQMPKDEAETFVAKFTKTVTGGTDLEVPVEVKIDKTATPFKYTIPKDADLADLAIKEADCPVTLKVSLWNDTDEIGEAQNFKVVKDEPEPEAAMGVSPLLSLLAAALLLLVKLF